MLAVICVSQAQEPVNQYTDGENASEWCGRSVYRCSPSVDRFNQVEERGKLLCVVRDRQVAAVKGTGYLHSPVNSLGRRSDPGKASSVDNY